MKNGDETRRPRSAEVWGAAAGLMILPVLVLRVIEGRVGDVGDFLFLLILIAALIGTYEVSARVTDRFAYAFGVGVATIATLLHVWINLAVGIVGSEDNPANLIYVAVIAVAMGGALLSRFRAAGLARAMIAAAAAQGLAFFVALIGGLGFTGPITIFFMGLWLISAWLFRRAEREKSPVTQE